jgi:hypothetical protein
VSDSKPLYALFNSETEINNSNEVIQKPVGQKESGRGQKRQYVDSGKNERALEGSKTIIFPKRKKNQADRMAAEEELQVLLLGKDRHEHFFMSVHLILVLIFFYFCKNIGPT